MNARTVLGMITGLALAIGATPSAKAVNGCTNALLVGSYGLQFSGTLTPELSGGVGGIRTPESAVARMGADTPAGANVAAGYSRLVMDGAGGVFGNTAVAIAGAWSAGPVSGSYNVNNDCTVTLTLTDSAGASQHFDGVATRLGESAMIIQTDAGVGISGALKRAPVFCQASDVNRSFQFRNAGSMIDTGGFSSIGLMNIDDQGNITATESRFSSGKYAQVASAGAIVVNSDCTVSLSMASADGSAANYQGILVNSAKELLLVRSDDGSAVTGSVVAQ
jgi:hypothetical protein